MYDVLTTAAMVDELREHVLDGRVQKLGMVDPVTIAAEVYANGRRRRSAARDRSRMTMRRTSTKRTSGADRMWCGRGWWSRSWGGTAT